MTLLDEAREIIKRYLDERQNISIAALARDADLPYSTARGIIQGEVKNPKIENVTALLERILPFSEILSLFEKYNGSEFWDGMVRLCADKKAESVAAKVGTEHEWKSPDHDIMALAGPGVTRDRVGKRFGEYGLERLEVLLSLGLLREINGAIKQQQEYVKYTLQDSIVKARLHANDWQKEEVDLGGFLYHLTQAISDIGLDKVKDAARRFLLEVTEIEKTHPGDRMLMLSILSNMIQG